MTKSSNPIGEMYLIVPKRRGRFNVDAAALKSVAEIHKPEPLDLLLMHEMEQGLFPLTRKYCRDNSIRPIEVDRFEKKSELLEKIRAQISNNKKRFAYLGYGSPIVQNDEIIEEISRELTDMGLTTEVRSKY